MIIRRLAAAVVVVLAGAASAHAHAFLASGCRAGQGRDAGQRRDPTHPRLHAGPSSQVEPAFIRAMGVSEQCKVSYRRRLAGEPSVIGQPVLHHVQSMRPARGAFA
jgi:hypothetical protein